MANYYTHFSLVMPLPDEAAQKYALNLVAQAVSLHMGDEQVPDDFPTSLRDVVEDWQFETEPSDPSDGWGLWLHTENGGIDAVCAFLQHLLLRFNPGAHVTLEWSHDCSKPRVDAYGGGAALITAKKIKTINTGEWLHRETTRIQRQPIER
jgi:hypothetical protein